MTDIVGPAGRQEKRVERKGFREGQEAHRNDFWLRLNDRRSGTDWRSRGRRCALKGLRGLD